VCELKTELVEMVGL